MTFETSKKICDAVVWPYTGDRRLYAREAIKAGALITKYDGVQMNVLDYVFARFFGCAQYVEVLLPGVLFINASGVKPWNAGVASYARRVRDGSRCNSELRVMWDKRTYSCSLWLVATRDIPATTEILTKNLSRPKKVKEPLNHQNYDRNQRDLNMGFIIYHLFSELQQTPTAEIYFQ